MTLSGHGSSCRAIAGSAVAGIVLIATGACAPPAGPRSADDLQPAGLGTPALAGLFVGCWALTWELEGGVSAAPLALVPDSVLLRDAVVFGTRERQVSPATHPSGRERVEGSTGPPPWETLYRVNRWWVEGESLQLRFSDGSREEWEVELGLEGDRLAGRAERTSEGRRDAAPRALVRGSRIGCAFS